MRLPLKRVGTTDLSPMGVPIREVFNRGVAVNDVPVILLESGHAVSVVVFRNPGRVSQRRLSQVIRWPHTRCMRGKMISEGVPWPTPWLEHCRRRTRHAGGGIVSGRLRHKRQGSQTRERLGVVTACEKRVRGGAGQSHQRFRVSSARGVGAGVLPG